jgi:hypothetical protein
VKFFIDTANVKEIREAASLGVVDGVTTNPSLVAKEGGLQAVIAEISHRDGPISAEALSLEADKVAEVSNWRNPQKRGGEAPYDQRRTEGHEGAGGKRHQGEHDPRLLTEPGAPCR